MVNLVTMLNTKLDHTLDELGKARTEIAELQTERAARHYQDVGSLTLAVIQHPYRSLPRGRYAYGTPDRRTQIDLEP
jgi:hypothetical protein